MNLFDIAGKVGKSLLRNTIPGVGLLLDTVNAVLPKDKQLTKEATGDDLTKAVNALPEGAAKAALLEKQFDVEIVELKETHETARAMIAAEAVSTHTTRPKIAYQAFVIVGFCTLLIVSMWSYAVLVKDSTLLKTIVDGWPFVLAILAPFIGWLNRYFGILRKEQQTKLEASTGTTLSSVSQLTKLFKR